MAIDFFAISPGQSAHLSGRGKTQKNLDGDKKKYLLHNGAPNNGNKIRQGRR